MTEALERSQPAALNNGGREETAIHTGGAQSDALFAAG